MSNVLGVVTPAAEIIALAHARGIPVLLDGCQAAVHTRVNVAELGVDYYAASGHKLYGPTGIGVLYGRRERLAALPPFEGGGEMIDQVTLDTVTYNDPPHRFEAGTPPILEAIGLGAAVEWFMAQDIPALHRHEKAMHDLAFEGLRGMNFVTLQGGHPDKSAVISFTMAGAHPHDVAQVLDRYGVAVRAGHHCAQPLMARLGVTATARASVGAYTSPEDIAQFLDALTRAHKLFQ
jgi:cysteine desulfurase/selenocysteine lyase